MKIKTVIILFFVSVLLCGCAENPRSSSGVSVVAATFPSYDFARAVCGEDSVSMLIPAGTEIHDFEPSPSDIQAIKTADLFIYTGGESDVWAEKILASLGKSEDATVRLIDSADLLCEDDSDEFDEHVWMSPANACRAVTAIADALSKADTAHKDNYISRSKAYCEKINEAANATEEFVKNTKNPTIVVADRFPLKYYCDYFGISYFAAFDACDHFVDADVSTVLRLINAVKDNNLEYIYCVENGSDALCDTVCRETGAKKLMLNTLHTVSREEFRKNKTYVDYMYENLSSIERGMQNAVD